ncbi:hypothetical protein L4X63_21845 [Geomonas sp. Red32]|uniref:hypothetical protein n=1 Tax=Geomonas sp. Red32 TaxID=2912856 RepID=UPI00202CDECD|nr:hypothetical protein [Geomonas sp. Red32]MCM0084230.1 hypothetical protein [Geomonas sp. Red32]
MNSAKRRAELCLDDILRQLEATKFHGSVTIHYASGSPRKIEYKSVHDLIGDGGRKASNSGS